MECKSNADREQRGRGVCLKEGKVELLVLTEKKMKGSGEITLCGVRSIYGICYNKRMTGVGKMW